RTPLVDRFLAEVGSDKSFFVIAQKGIGKTLLLKMKSLRYRDKGGYIVIPETPLVEKASGGSEVISLSQETLQMFKHRQNWQTAWSIALAISILRRTQTPIPSEIDDRVPLCSGVFDYVTL